LGYLYIQRKQIDLALNHLEHALKSEQNFTPGIAALGLALRRKGDSLDNDGHQAERDLFWGQAESRLLEALSQDHRLTDADGESYFGTLGGLYRRQKRYYAALDAYERAYQVTPNSSYPLINLASIHTHEGNLKQARHYFEKVVEQARLALDDDPRNAWRRCDLAQALLVMSQQDEALKELRAVIKQDPERSVLETVRSGLSFLSESPERIAGLDEMISLLDETLQGAGV
jgi:tetratricopeptide (TPR) repeat protein